MDATIVQSSEPAFVSRELLDKVDRKKIK